jgi:hypothetical protein
MGYGAATLDLASAADNDGLASLVPDPSFGGETDPSFDAANTFDQQMDALFQGDPDAESEQANLSLEEIVEREIQQYDPFGAQDPFGPTDPFGPMEM